MQFYYNVNIFHYLERKYRRWGEIHRLTEKCVINFSHMGNFGLKKKKKSFIYLLLVKKGVGERKLLKKKKK